MILLSFPIALAAPKSLPRKPPVPTAAWPCSQNWAGLSQNYIYHSRFFDTLIKLLSFRSWAQPGPHLPPSRSPSGLMGRTSSIGAYRGVKHSPSIASEIPLSALQLCRGGPFSPSDVSRLPLQSLPWAGSPPASPPSRAWAALACGSARVVGTESISEPGGWTNGLSELLSKSFRVGPLFLSCPEPGVGWGATLAVMGLTG